MHNKIIIIIIGNKTLKGIQQMLLRTRKDVFGGLSVANRSERIEKMLKNFFGEDKQMNTITPPNAPKYVNTCIYLL